MSLRGAVYNTPVQTNASTYPIIGMTGLLNLVAVVEKFQMQTLTEKGALCQPTPCPPARKPQRAAGPVGEAAPGESSTPPVATQPATGASTARLSSAAGRTAMSPHPGSEEWGWYTEKIRPQHVERLAVVYVRQSAMQQVL